MTDPRRLAGCVRVLALFAALHPVAARAQDSAPAASRPAPEDDPADVDLVVSLYDEAVAAEREGDFESAAELTARADAERRLRLRHDHASIANALSDLAERRALTGRIAEAQPLHDAARATWGMLCKGDHLIRYYTPGNPVVWGAFSHKGDCVSCPLNGACDHETHGNTVTAVCR